MTVAQLTAVGFLVLAAIVGLIAWYGHRISLKDEKRMWEDDL